MKKRKIILVSILIILFLIISSGCISYRDEDHPWQIHYEAEYDHALDFSAIINIFEIEKIYYKIEDDETLTIKYGKGINNDSIEMTSGAIVNAKDVDYYHLGIHLGNMSKFPRVENKNDLKSRKPLLEESMNYITNIIYEATGQQPKSLEFDYGRLYI